MLLLVIVAFIATTTFYAIAKRCGLHPGRAATLPFAVLGVLLIFAHVAGLVLAKFLPMADVTAFAENSILFAFNVTLMLAYLAYIRKNWIALSSRSVISKDTDESSS